MSREHFHALYFPDVLVAVSRCCDTGHVIRLATSNFFIYSTCML